MSLESLHSRNTIIEGATSLETALAILLADLRADQQRWIDGMDAEKRAAIAAFQVVYSEFKVMKDECTRWLTEMQKQKIEMRGEKGEPGAIGPPGETGAQGIAGTAGRDGRDGLPGIAGRDGAAGADGKDGKDGLGVADFQVDYDERRTVILRWTNGERTVEKKLVFPFPIHVGIWESDRSYEAHDQVTYAGGQFKALRDTAERPGTDDWQLVTKRGAPGTNGKPGERGPQGLPGKDGRDATQLGPHGGKW